MEKKLEQLIAAIKPVKIIGGIEKTITDLVCDSRKVTPGALFVAVRGVSIDAHQYIQQVVATSGAVAVVCETIPAVRSDKATYIQVDNSAQSLALLANEWFDRPSEKLKLVGVTGTNGKTTTATLLYEMAEYMGFKAGLLSTVRNIVHKTVYEAKQTTPDSLSLNALLRQMVDEGCEYAFMEVSSHACVQYRIDGIQFAGGIFSNLTRDHLDYHLTVANYIAAKKRFFDLLGENAFALVNADDKNGLVMLQNTRARRRTYSLRTMADYMTKIIETRMNGTTLSINNHEVNVLFTGRFNAYNLTAVFGAAVELGLPIEDVLVKMSMLVPVAGRFQTMQSRRGYTAIVDYAHTPDALDNVICAIRDIIGKNANIITVVGAGGNRDSGKRPLMAAMAANLSDKVVLTSDNPRFEDPEAILADMEQGLNDEMRTRTVKIADRREALKTACGIAQPGDVVLVAGKGHENYQEIKGVKHHFDDKEEIEAIFAAE